MSFFRTTAVTAIFFLTSSSLQWSFAEVQQIGDLLQKEDFATDHGQSSKVDVKLGGLRGPVYSEIAAVIEAASQNDSHLAEPAEQTHVEEKDVSLIEITPCEDIEGETPVRLNKKFATCLQLLKFCDEYKEVRDVCPATCGLCSNKVKNPAELISQQAQPSMMNAFNTFEDEQVSNGSDDADHESIENDTSYNRESSVKDEEAQVNVKPVALSNDTNTLLEAERTQEKAAMDKMTAEEHIAALTLLLKQISMENEHLKLSMAQCEADMLELKMNILDQHSQH
jgi:hypothetical protein